MSNTTFGLLSALHSPEHLLILYLCPCCVGGGVPTTRPCLSLLDTIFPKNRVEVGIPSLTWRTITFHCLFYVWSIIIQHFKLEFQNSEMVENEVMLAVFYMNILFSILHLPLTFVPGVGEVLNKQFLLFTIKALESLSCKNSESNFKKNFLVQNIYKNWNVF